MTNNPHMSGCVPDGNAAAIFVAIGPDLYGRLFTPDADQALRALGDLRLQAGNGRLAPAELAHHLKGARILVTGWSSPRLTREVLDAAAGLRLVAHVGGTVRALLDEDVFARGIAVVNAAHAMVPAVAEFTLLQILRALRRPERLEDRLRRREPWNDVRAAAMGSQLAGTRVGVVGAGAIGRRVIGLLRAFGAEPLVFDPLLPPPDAAAMGCRKADLREVMSGCRLVTLHAPALPETQRMIGAAELALLPDGAWLVNTARSWLIDGDALLRELRSGRIGAALDVFDEEPLPADSPFRGLANCLPTPHAAFMTEACFREFGESTVAEIRRFLAGEPLLHRVTPEMLRSMA